MTSSGTYNYQLSNGEAVLAAFDRIGMSATEIKQRHMTTARRAIVYCVRNLVTGDEYVGATEKSLDVRKANHLYHAARTPKLHFHRAVAKYGADNFEWTVLEECADFFAALEAERRHIADRRPAYNKTEGGGGVKGYRHTAAAKKKMRAAKAGKPGIWARMSMPAEVREKLAQCRRAERGKVISDDVKKKMLGNIAKASAVRRHPVMDLATGTVYPSVQDAAKALRVCKNTVMNLCRTGRKSRRLGLQLKYCDKVSQ